MEDFTGVRRLTEKLTQVQTLSGKTRATGATLAPRLTEPLLLEKTGFQVTLIDRIWVITEALARPLCWTREDCQLYIYSRAPGGTSDSTRGREDTLVPLHFVPGTRQTSHRTNRNWSRVQGVAR
jgi:hypothetical protein